MMSSPLQLVHNNTSPFVSSVRGQVSAFLVLLLLSFNVSAASFFKDGFETGDFTHTENGFKWGSKKNMAVSTLKPRTGSQSLQFTFPASVDGKDSFSEQRFLLGGNYPELWIRYDLYVPANYYHRTQTSSGNNKFIYLWSGTYSADFTGPGLSVQNWPTSNGESKGVPKAKGSHLAGGGFLFDKHYNPDGGQIFEVADRGKWLTIIIHVKYATSANDNGIFQLWKIRDGTLISVIDKTDGNWYVPGQPGFDQGYLMGWANSGFDKETIFYLDNIEFSTTPLLDGILAAPKPPTILP